MREDVSIQKVNLNRHTWQSLMMVTDEYVVMHKNEGIRKFLVNISFKSHKESWIKYVQYIFQYKSLIATIIWVYLWKTFNRLKVIYLILRKIQHTSNVLSYKKKNFDSKIKIVFFFSFSYIRVRLKILS